MVTKALLVRIDAKRGKEDAVASLLLNALPIVQGETQTTAWFAVRLGFATFAIFDAFPDEAGREAHLNGRVAAALKVSGEELIERLVIDQVDVLASKLPGA